MVEIIAACRAALEANPDGHLEIGRRYHVYRGLGAPGNASAKPRAIGHVRRTRLFCITSRKVLPTWEAAFPDDETPHELLHWVDRWLAGESLPTSLHGAVSDWWTYLDNALTNHTDRDDPAVQAAIMAGTAAAATLSAALKDVLLLDGVDLDRRDVDYDPYELDPPWHACRAYLCGPTTVTSEPESLRRKAFWEWWLDDAVSEARSR